MKKLKQQNKKQEDEGKWVNGIYLSTQMLEVRQRLANHKREVPLNEVFRLATL